MKSNIRVFEIKKSDVEHAQNFPLSNTDVLFMNLSMPETINHFVIHYTG